MKKSLIILLIIFISIAVALNYMPHIDYKYPLHVDEYVHYQYSNHYSSDASLYFTSNVGYNLEAGFHYILSVLNVFGMDYLFMFNFLPSLIVVLICLGVFVFTRRIFGETAGVYSVLFIALLKSSAMILGSVLLVPMAIGLLLIVIGLFLIKEKSYALILVLSSLLIIHPPSAIAFLLLINIEFIFMHFKKEQNYLKSLLMQLIAWLIALPFYIPVFLRKGVETIDSLKFTPITGVVFIPRYIGWILIIIVLAGIYYSVEKKKYNLAVYVGALLGFIFLFYKFRVEYFIPYARALMYLFLIFAVLFGAGFVFISDIFVNKKIKVLVVIALIIAVLIFGIIAKIDSNGKFYRIIDEKDYDAFLWIKENTNKNDVAVLDPWIANAFTPFAERGVYTRVTQGPNAFYSARNIEVENFFKDKCKNMSFLAENNISIVYDKTNTCDNIMLEKAYDGVYLIER